MTIKNFTPPLIISLALLGGVAIYCYRHAISRWWHLKSYPCVLEQIYRQDRKGLIKVDCFSSDFRASIPIYKGKDGCFYTTYDFEKNRLEGADSIYVSVNGNDDNSGLTVDKAKRSIESALKTKAHNVILLKGHYQAGVNFKNSTELSDVNLIGKDTVVIDNMERDPFVVTGNVFIRNIDFVNGNKGSLRAFIKDPRKTCTYIDCKFNSSLIDNVDVSKAQSLGGLRIQGGTHYLYRCEASHNGFDGFSYHAAPDGSTNAPHVVEVECKAFHNGEHNAYESNNASTAHDGTIIIRLNGEYGYSHGGNVADVHNNTVSFNIGCTAYSVMDLGKHYREYQTNYFCASNAVMYLLGCKSHGSYYDISYWNGGNIFSDKNYQRKYEKDGNLILLRK